MKIWGCNETVPAAVVACVHDLIAETTRRQRGAPVVCAWDGELNNVQLDNLSSWLAHHLVGLGSSTRSGGAALLRKVDVDAGGNDACFGVMKSWRRVCCDGYRGTGRPVPELLLNNRLQASIISSSMRNQARSGATTGKRHNIRRGGKCTYPQAFHVFRRVGWPCRRWTLSCPIYVVFSAQQRRRVSWLSHRNFSSAIRYQQPASGFEKA